MQLFRRIFTTGLVTVMAGALMIVVASTSSTADATQPVAGILPQVVQGVTDLGPAPAQELTVTLALSLRNASELSSLLSGLYDPSSPEYHHFLTPAAFTEAFSPSTTSLHAVEAWATGAGLSIVSASADSTLVEVKGSLAALGAAFGVTFDRYLTPGGTSYIASAEAATVPVALSGLVSSVVGLSTLDRASLAPVVTPTISYPSSYDPGEFWSFYNAPSDETGTGQTIAVLAAGTLTQPEKDLVTFEHDFDLPAVPWTTVRTGPASTTTTGDDEWDLDTQYSTGMAGQVSSLVVYDGSSLTDSTILTETDTWVTDDVAKQADFSAGECELLADEAGFLSADDEVLEQADAQGQSLFVAAGDTGAFCPALVGENGVPAGLPDVDYPASSPYAIGAGGTSILDGPGPLREIGWYAGGGGLSIVEPEPSYQAGVGGSNLGIRRGVPDVSFDADPNSGFEVIVDGQETVVGGTSGASPSWLGIWARAQAAHGGDLGFANPTIYAEPSTAFNDITVGDNGIYPCTPGYDYVTGRGTPDIATFVADA